MYTSPEPQRALPPPKALIALQPPPPFVAPTVEIAQSYQGAYDYFNEKLFLPIFGELLPHVVLNLSRKGRGNTAAFFHAGQWKAAADGTILAEISICPHHTGVPIKDLFSSLVHEMAHFRDALDGTACKNGYHGRAWFKIMKKLGLPGRALSKSMISVDHDIEPGGAYELAFHAMPKNLKMPFTGSPRQRKVNNTLQGVRMKYECPSCGLNVRGKSGLSLRCDTCDEVLHDSGI